VIIDKNITVPAPPAKVWDFMMDVPAVSRCVPGVESVEVLDAENYRGVLKIKVGPISIKLEGNIRLAERDRDNWHARMDAQAADKRVNGAVNAKMGMKLTERPDGQTDLAIHTDAAILGKLGEFGQAVMRKKADQMIAEFAKNLAKEVGTATPA
jgi:carbon monoxide dehydrogenase subunit G